MTGVGSGGNPLSVCEWLELAVQADDLERSRAAVVLLHDFIDALPHLRDEVVGAKLVLLKDGSFAQARYGEVYFAGSSVGSVTKPLLHPDLERDEKIANILRYLGVKDADDRILPNDVLRRINDAGADDDVSELWRQFWLLMVDPSSSDVLVNEAFDSLDELDLRPDSFLLPNDVGGMEHASLVFLPGQILDSSSTDADKRWLVEATLADRFGRRLSTMGVTDRPRAVGGRIEWEDEYRAFLRASSDLNSKPRLDRWIRELSFPSHLALINDFSGESIARLVSSYLRQGIDAWSTMEAEELSKDYLLWVIRHKGLLPSVRGPLSPGQALSPELARFQRVLPVADVTLHEAELLGLATDAGNLEERVLDDALRRLEDETNPTLIGSALAFLSAALKEPPSLIPAHVGNVVERQAPEVVSVVSSKTTFDDHTMLNVPVVCVESESDANALVDRWGMSRAVVEGGPVFDTTQPSDEEVIADKFQGLIDHMRDSSCDRLVLCKDLGRRISYRGYKIFKVPHLIEGTCVYLESDGLPGPGDERDKQVLQKLNVALGLGLSADQMQQVLDSRKSADALAIEKECRRIARRSNRVGVHRDAEILAALFSLDDLLKLLPASLAEQIGEEKSDKNALAKLALAVWGVEVLTQRDAKNILRRNGHNVPKQFSGSREARNFVRDLGLDTAYAGFPGLDRDKHIEIHPRTEEVRMHQYQVGVQEKLREHIRTPPTDSVRGWRSLLYMPTGAGKTRVTVQSIVDSLNAGELRHPRVVWIAGSDELCEQAVQTFADVWRSTGLNGMLSIERLWASNEVVEEQFDADCVGQVVVATHQKLAANISEDQWHPEYKWLRNSGLLVIDEAHSAASQSFTSILSAMGFERRQLDRTKDPMPLLGLTATPKEKIRRRFGGKAGRIGIDLPDGVTDFEFLKNEKVLSRVRNEVIRGMVIKREGTDELPKNFPRNPWLPSAYDQQIESNEVRNKAIIDHIKSQIPIQDSLILVFAASVAHAQILAALLAREDIPAAAVSGETPRKLRQHYVKEFKEGRIRVLTNYGVLTQGFDNPKVNVVYVTRPVFSAASYLQMVGRGLRGPLNGGTDECLIVDIDDNLESFPDLKLVYGIVNDWFRDDGAGDLPDDPDDFEDE